MSTATETPIILSVGQITWAIKSQLEKLFPNIWVKGEVSNLKKQASGHLYFSLIDEGAQIAAVMFKGDASNLPIPFNNGDTIIVKGDLNVYPQRGNYQIVVRSITHAGLGDQLIKLQLLKKKIEALGWTSKERKRPLPEAIERIVLVTSPTGAVLRDICQILQRRMAGFHLIINPVRVQGETAGKEIAKAIRECSQYKLGDVLILCRGGGSAEDLAPFNDEEVAKAIVECSIPIVSAVGHETDFTIADLVADLRAPTPSAAAELVSHEKAELEQKLLLLRKGIFKSYRLKLHNLMQSLSKLALQKSLSLSPTVILNRSQQLDDLQDGLEKIFSLRLKMKQKQLSTMEKFVQTRSPAARLQMQTQQLQRIQIALEKRLRGLLLQKIDSMKPIPEKLDKGLRRFIESKIKNLQGREQQLIALNPYQVLKRGYAVVRRVKDKGVISSVHALKVDDRLEIVLQDGTARAAVQEILDETR